MNALKKILIRIFVVMPFQILCTVRNWYSVWYWVLNRRGRLHFNANRPAPGEVGERVLKDLKRDGISITTLEELFPGEDMYLKLDGYSKGMSGTGEENKERGKPFLKFLWDRRAAVLDFGNPFLQFSLHPNIINVVNSYLGLSGRLYDFRLNETIPVPENSPRQQSQRWHRDPEDKIVCKVFLYLNDVDESAGPFMYVAGSHYGGKYARLFPPKLPKGIYPQDKDVDKFVAPQDIRSCVGKAGTVIFCDTTGIHRGGYATKNRRLMFNCGFYSDASIRLVRLKTGPDFSAGIASQSPLARYALSRAPKKLMTSIFFRFKKHFPTGGGGYDD